jgi:hypothetical protein
MFENFPCADDMQHVGMILSTCAPATGVLLPPFKEK